MLWGGRGPIGSYLVDVLHHGPNVVFHDRRGFRQPVSDGEEHLVWSGHPDRRRKRWMDRETERMNGWIGGLER